MESEFFQFTDELSITRRKLPHWSITGAIYFIVFKSAIGLLTLHEQRIVHDNVLEGNPSFYLLLASVVMPDHVHCLIYPFKYELKRVLKGIKQKSATAINELRGRRGLVWIHESYDRIVRSNLELSRFLNYMLSNPYKKKLVKADEKYEFWFYNDEFELQLSKYQEKLNT